jgi:pyridoxine 5-phosphate synthase
MTKLSVNINKVALIRNSRLGNMPNLLTVAKDCELWGAQGITVHPRPDERHVRYSDLQPLRDQNTTEFNIEGYPDERFLKTVMAVKPHQCTLVPDPPGVLTSDTGWDTKGQFGFLQDVVGRLKSAGIRVSLFLNPEEEMVDYAARIGTDRIELYTGKFAHDFEHDPDKAVAAHVLASQAAATLGLGLNAGHDLNLKNLKFYRENVVDLLEVSIGHALICDAIYYGLQNSIQMYLSKLS